MNDVNTLTSNGVNVQSSLELLGDMEMYNETLSDFLDMVEEKKSNLEKFKAESDMPNYAIAIHALKSDARYLGFLELGDLAYDSELKAKASDQAGVEANHQNIMDHLDQMVNIACTYLGRENPFGASAAPVAEMPAPQGQVQSPMVDASQMQMPQAQAVDPAAQMMQGVQPQMQAQTPQMPQVQAPMMDASQMQMAQTQSMNPTTQVPQGVQMPAPQTQVPASPQMPQAQGINPAVQVPQGVQMPIPQAQMPAFPQMQASPMAMPTPQMQNQVYDLSTGQMVNAPQNPVSNPVNPQVGGAYQSTGFNQIGSQMPMYNQPGAMPNMQGYDSMNQALYQRELQQQELLRLQQMQAFQMQNPNLVPKAGTILVVDDSNLVANFVKKIFDSRYDVVIASDGEKAIELCADENFRKKIKACLLDLNMPNVDGYQVLDDFYQKGYFVKMPIAVISGVEDMESIDRVNKYPIIDILAKPFNERDVQRVVEKCLAVYF